MVQIISLEHTQTPEISQVQQQQDNLFRNYDSYSE